MKLDFNFTFKNLDGKEVIDETNTPVNAGKYLANTLAGSREGDALKMWDWATKLYNGKDLDLDASDLPKLKDFIEKSHIWVLGKAQLLSVFNKK